MANTPIQFQPNELTSSLSLIETLQSPKIRTGGASSSRLFNELISRIKRDLLKLGNQVEDVSDMSRIQALMLSSHNAALASEIGSLRSLVAGLSGNGSSNRALADFYANFYTVPSSTTSDVNPLFGQAILPAISRQNVLAIERGNGESPAIPAQTHVKFCIQPTVTGTLGVTAPADYLFAEDLYSVLCLDGRDDTFWPVEDPNAFGHMCWLEIDLPGDISGAYQCNELEFVPWPSLSFDIVSVQAEVIGQGWQALDFSYLSNYDPSTQAVRRAGPGRLCFARTSITRIRLGLWCSSIWGFQHIRVLNTTYQQSANLVVNFASATSNPLLTTTLLGKNQTQLTSLPISVTGQQLGTVLSPSGSSTETPIVTGISTTF